MEFSLNTNNNKVEPKSSRELLAYFAINSNSSSIPNPLNSEIPNYSENRHYATFSFLSLLRCSDELAAIGEVTPSRYVLKAFYYWYHSNNKDMDIIDTNNLLLEGSKVVNTFGQTCLVPEVMGTKQVDTNMLRNKFLAEDFPYYKFKTLQEMLHESFKLLESKSHDLKKLESEKIDETYLQKILNGHYGIPYNNTDLISKCQPLCRAFNAFADYFLAMRNIVIGHQYPMSVYMGTKAFKAEFATIVCAFEVADQLISTPDERQDFMRFIMFLLLKQSVDRELWWVLELCRDGFIGQIIVELKKELIPYNVDKYKDLYVYKDDQKAIKIVEDIFPSITNHLFIFLKSLFEDKKDLEFFLKQYLYIVALDKDEKLICKEGARKNIGKTHEDLIEAYPHFYLLRAIYQKMLHKHKFNDKHRKYKLQTDLDEIDKGCYMKKSAYLDRFQLNNSTDEDFDKAINLELDKFVYQENKFCISPRDVRYIWRNISGDKYLPGHDMYIIPITNMNRNMAKEMPAKKASEMAEVKDEEPAQREKDTENPIMNNSETYNFDQFLDVRWGLNYSWEDYRKLKTEKINIDEELKEQDVKGAELNRREAAASAAA